MQRHDWKYADCFALSMSVNANIELHRHSYFELVYVLEGKAKHHFNGTDMLLAEGDYFVMDTTGVHGYRPCPGESFRIINCCFYGEFLDASLASAERLDTIIEHPLLGFCADQLRLRPTETIFRDDGILRPLVEQMFHEYTTRQPGYRAAIRAQLLYLLISLLRRAAEGESPDAGHALTHSAIAYIEKHATAHCTLEDAAAALNYSPPYLSRRFKLDTGTTFSAYLQDVRIKNACRLLANTDLPIERIANMVGYRDMKHFHRIFRRAKGQTPREYRTARNIK